MKKTLTKSSRTAPALPTRAKTKNRSALAVVPTGPDDMDAAIARTLTSPENGAAAVIEAWQKDTHDVNELAAVLAVQVQAVNAGELGRAEGILISQAHTLDAIFVNLMRRAVNQTTMPHWEAFMRMGMKAQSQCRATLQALGELKNPPVFARQTNISNGPQQVNNGAPTNYETSTRACAPAQACGEIENQPSKLLEGMSSGSTTLDAGATGAAARGNQAMEAVGAVHRPQKRGRQSQS